MPAITGVQLIKLLKLDGWIERGKANHGKALSKLIDNKNVVTIVPYKKDSLPNGTLSAILGVKQTRLGKKGLQDLIEQYGMPANSWD